MEISSATFSLLIAVICMKWCGTSLLHNYTSSIQMSAVNRLVTTRSQIEGDETLRFYTSYAEWTICLQRRDYMNLFSPSVCFSPSAYITSCVSMQVLDYLSEMRGWMTCLNIVSALGGIRWTMEVFKQVAGVLIAWFVTAHNIWVFGVPSVCFSELTFSSWSIC